MPDENQTPGAPVPETARTAPEESVETRDRGATSGQGGQAAFAPSTDDPVEKSPVEKGLGLWLGLIVASIVASMAFRTPELAVLAGLAGIFAVAHAADLEARWIFLNQTLGWALAAAASLVTFGLLAVILPEEGAPGRWLAIVITAGAPAAFLSTAWPPIGKLVARALFRNPEPSRAVVLAAHLLLVGVLGAVPLTYLFRVMPDLLERELITTPGLWGSLIGMVLLAGGAVGTWVRRDPRHAAARLGLEPLPFRNLWIVPVGVAALVILNFSGEWLQRRYAPAAWAADQRVGQMIAGDLGPGEALLLSLSAGVGEELTLRGALQPRLGLLRTSLFFGLLHVQYSWTGISVILGLGLVLGTIRRRAGTTAAILVHALYDLAVVLAIPRAG